MKSAICWSKLNIIEEADQERQKIGRIDRDQVQEDDPQILRDSFPDFFEIHHRFSPCDQCGDEEFLGVVFSARHGTGAPARGLTDPAR